MTDSYQHISERPVVPIGKPPTSAGNTYINTTSTYDVAIGGIPFFMATSDKYPYKRETAQYRKQQIDMQKDPGEQTLTSWWLRSQSSFHLGAGIRYEEPITGNSISNRFNKSAGVDVFNIGQIELINDTAKIAPVANFTYMIGAKDTNDVDLVIWTDGTTLHRTTADGTTTTLAWGGSGTILSIAQDGENYYAADNTAIYQGPLTGASNGVQIFAHPAVAGTVTSVKLGWVKARLMAGINNYLFEVQPITIYSIGANSQVTINSETATDSNVSITLYTTQPANFSYGSSVTFTGTGTAIDDIPLIISNTSGNLSNQFSINQIVTGLVSTGSTTTNLTTGTVSLTTNNDIPTYVHPNLTWKYTGICDGPNDIYVSGYSGTQSIVLRLTLDTTGTGGLIPLVRASTGADMPEGEYILAMQSYIGKYFVLGTNKGIRVGTIDTSGYLSSGYITYGPLTVITNGWDPVSGKVINGEPCYAVTFDDRYAYCTVSNYIDSDGFGTLVSGLVKIDLSRDIAPNEFAYATNLQLPTNVPAVAVCPIGTTGKLAIGAQGDGIYFQQDTYISSGYLQTGLIRYFTLEDKHFKLVKLLAKNPIVSNIKVSTVLDDGSVNDIISVGPSFDFTQDISTNLTEQRSALALRFTLYPTADRTQSTLMSGYQLKALPAVPRTRIITVPLLNYDFEVDRYNMEIGYEGRAAERLAQLETLENPGNVLIFQDFTTGETVSGVIESMSFERLTPPERRFKGAGGTIMLQFRTV